MIEFIGEKAQFTANPIAFLPALRKSLIPVRGVFLMSRRTLRILGRGTVLLFWAVLLCGCGAAAPPETDLPWPLVSVPVRQEIPAERDGLEMTVDPDTLSADSALFWVDNRSDSSVSCGTDYTLDVLVDGSWYEIDCDADHSAELLTIAPGERLTLTYGWEERYGALPPGDYRLVKSFQSGAFRTVRIACAFRVEG